MKNHLQETPSLILHGRTKASVDFVSDKDIADKTILDVGCGYGWCELNFLSRNALSITATEASEEDLATIREHIHDPRVTLAVAPAPTMPFASESFDTIVCWEVLEHIPSRTEQKFYKEIFRVLRPGGALYLSTPNRAILPTILDPAWWLIGHRHYTAHQLTIFGKQAGFTLERTALFGKFWTMAAILNLYTSKWIFKGAPIGQHFFYKKTDEEYSKDGYTNIFVQYRKGKP